MQIHTNSGSYLQGLLFSPSSLQQPRFSEQARSQRMANTAFRGEGGRWEPHQGTRPHILTTFISTQVITINLRKEKLTG